MQRVDRRPGLGERQGPLVSTVHRWTTVAAAIAWAAWLGVAAPAAATSLSGEIGQFFDRNAFPARGHVFSQLISPLIERIALRGVDLPVAATSPAFAYRFSFEGGAPERLDASLGLGFRGTRGVPRDGAGERSVSPTSTPTSTAGRAAASRTSSG